MTRPDFLDNAFPQSNIARYSCIVIPMISMNMQKTKWKEIKQDILSIQNWIPS